MVFADLRTEEKLGLGIALALHVALATALLVQPETRAVVPPVEKMTVNLTTDVGLTATAPDPVPTSAAASAPVFSPEPAPPEPVAAPEPAPAPEPVVQPRPEPPRAKPVERAVAKPQPAPVRKPATKPQPKPVERTAATPQPKAQPKAQPNTQAKPATQPRRAASTATRQPNTSKPAGASRVGSDFLAGAGDSTTTRETRTPASQIGASAKASLFQQIAKELRPKWQPPSGPEVEKLVTKVRFRLNADGSLIGRPEVVRQTGETDTNKPQASRHAEQAIRAVQLAAPFDLPEEYYEAFKVVTVDFDWKLAQ